jgi:copper transport protein
MRRALGAVALAFAILVVLAAPASAHAQLVSTTPSAGAVLDRAPSVAKVRFNEGIQVKPDGLQLHDASGARLDTGEVRHVDGGKEIDLPLGDLDDGGYVLTWRIVSADGHPVSGGVTWRIGQASQAVDQSMFESLLNAQGGDATLHVVADVVRGLLFLSLLVLIGGLLFVLVVWPAGADDHRLRPTVRAAAAVAAVTTALGMGMEGADVAGLGLSHALSVGTALDTLDGSYGTAAVVRLVLLAVLAGLAAVATPERVRRTSWRGAVLVASAGTLLTLSLSGHARTGRWVALALPLDLVHLGAAALWIGGLLVLTLVVLPQDEEGSTAPLVARFSRVAFAAVVAIVATGVVQGYRQLGSIDAVRTTGYGRLLVIKTVVVALVVLFAARSRTLVRAQVEDRVLVGPAGDEVEDDEDDEDDEWIVEPADVRRALRRSVAAEALLAVAVLAVTSLLVAADPGRTISVEGFSAARVVQGTVIEAVAAPARTGPVDFHVYVSDPTIGLTTQLSATATLSLPEKGIHSVQVPLRPAGRGHWSAYDVDIPIKGSWRYEIQVAVGDFDSRRALFSIPIR